MARMGHGSSMERLQVALLSGPKSVNDLIGLGIPRATVYRDVKKMVKLGQIAKVEERDRRGNSAILYALTEAIIPASPDMVNELFQRIDSDTSQVRNNAIDDLRVVCKDSRISNIPQLTHLVTYTKAKPEIRLLEILNFQAILAIKSDDINMLKALNAFKPTAESIVKNTKKSTDERYQALRFLQLTAEFDELSSLALNVISNPHDPALSTAQPSQLAIILQSICINASRLTKYRSRIYDLLLADDASVNSMAQQILQLSRQPLIR